MAATAEPGSPSTGNIRHGINLPTKEKATQHKRRKKKMKRKMENARRKERAKE